MKFEYPKIPEPVAIWVETCGTGKLSNQELADAIREIFPFKPRDIIGVIV